MNERHPIWQLLDRLQMDNRAQAAKLVELRAQVAALGILPDMSHRENAAAYRSFTEQREEEAGLTSR